VRGLLKCELTLDGLLIIDEFGNLQVKKAFLWQGNTTFIPQTGE